MSERIKPIESLILLQDEAPDQINLKLVASRAVFLREELADVRSSIGSRLLACSLGTPPSITIAIFGAINQSEVPILLGVLGTVVGLAVGGAAVSSIKEHDRITSELSALTGPLTTYYLNSHQT